MQTFKKIVKGLACKDNGRSSDFITPSLIFGCGFNCSYCTLKRHNYDTIQIAENYKEILASIDKHVHKQKWSKTANQCDDTYYVYDIGCNTDVSLHWKQLDWLSIFDFFKENPRALASFATKYVREEMLDYNPEYKVRIRFSLMPQEVSSIVEPKTSSIKNRILAIDKFKSSNYQVHINFSPIIVKDNWLNDYKLLFEELNDSVASKKDIKSECIFLTHNENFHNQNLERNTKGEDLLWQPFIQEAKVSSYGGKNIRYKWQLKNRYIKEFTALYNKHLPWCEIRYIF